MTVPFPPDADLVAQLTERRPRLLRRIAVRRRTTRAAIVCGVILLGSSGTAATLAVAQASRDAIRTTVTCFSHDDLASFSSGAGMAQAIGEPAPDVDLATKREMCGLVWRSGLKQAAATGTWPRVDPNTSTLPVPPLALCRLSDGTTGGFPVEAPATTSAEVCARLGLAHLG